MLTGDGTGSASHEIPGMVKISNAGLANFWLTLTNPAGSLMHGESGVIGVRLDAAGLTPRDYRCDLVVRDLYNNKVVVPVTFHVMWPVGAGPDQGSSSTSATCFPNPFTQSTVIRYELPAAGDVTLEIFNQGGTLLGQWKIDDLPQGKHTSLWDGSDGQGHPLPAGVYTCRITQGHSAEILKMILIR